MILRTGYLTAVLKNVQRTISLPKNFASHNDKHLWVQKGWLLCKPDNNKWNWKLYLIHTQKVRGETPLMKFFWWPINNLWIQLFRKEVSSNAREEQGERGLMRKSSQNKILCTHKKHWTHAHSTSLITTPAKIQNLSKHLTLNLWTGYQKHTALLFVKTTKIIS